jgi:hypothetical protein
MPHSKPCRAPLRWLEGAPANVLDVFDDGGHVADRYTVFIVPEGGYLECGSVPYLAVGDTPDGPLGFSQWGELGRYYFTLYRNRENRNRIRWLALPANVRAHVTCRLEI